MSKRLCISLLHAPSRSPQPLLQRCILQPINTTGPGNPKPRRHVRPFTSTPSHRVGAGRQVSNRRASQPSMAVQLKTQQRQAQDTGALLDHVGVIEGTFIPPTGQNLPSPLKDFRGRLKLEYRRFMQLVFDWGRNHFQRIFFIRPRPILGRREAARLSKGLYEGMYAHFARGDLSPVESTLAPGLISSLRARIAQRPANSSLLWTMHGYLSQPAVISHKLAMMPGKGRKNTEQVGIEQVVVKMRSRQSLLRMQKMKITRLGKTVVENVPADSVGNRIPEDLVESFKRRASKDATEYVVVQRFMKRSQFGPWHLWGTTEEATLDKLKREERLRTDNMLRTAGQR